MRLALLLSLGACSFTARARAQSDADIDAAIADTPLVDGMVDAQIIDARRLPDARPPPFCASADPTLVACYEFEGNTNDASGHQLDAAMTGVTFVQGKQGMAAHATAAARMNVAENALENPAALTVEAWIKAPIPTAGNRAGILDNEGVWGFFLQEQGELQCLGGGNVAAGVPANTWTHVACTYDSNGTRVIYVNGVAVSTVTGGGALPSSGASGWTIAANSPDDTSSLGGDIDQLRVFSVARTAQQICADAGCQ